MRLAASLFSRAVKILAAKPTGVGEIRPEAVSAFFRVHPAASVLVAAHTHLAFAGFFNRVPSAVAVFRAAADRTRSAVVHRITPSVIAAATATVVTTTSHK